MHQNWIQNNQIYYNATFNTNETALCVWICIHMLQWDNVVERSLVCCYFFVAIVYFVLYFNSLEISENNRNKQLNMNFNGKMASSHLVFSFFIGILFIENTSSIWKFVYEFMCIFCWYLHCVFFVFGDLLYLPVHLNLYRFKHRSFVSWYRIFLLSSSHALKSREKRNGKDTSLVKLICLHLGFSFEWLDLDDFDAPKNKNKQNSTRSRASLCASIIGFVSD